MNLSITDQLCLSEFRPSDRRRLIECLNDRDIYERTLRIPHPYTEKSAEEWLTLAAQMTMQQGRPVCWALRQADDALIGGLGFDGMLVAGFDGPRRGSYRQSRFALIGHSPFPFLLASAIASDSLPNSSNRRRCTP